MPAWRRRRTAVYRKRKPTVAIVILAALIIATGVVWIKIFNHAGNVNAQTACPAPVTKAAGRTDLPYTALDNVVPQPADNVQVTVLNGSSQRGLATRISAELTQLGFAQAGQPSDDPEYPKGNMRCYGQIRFGANGESAARTLSFVVPCAQLVRDNRQDATVDLAVGTNFTDLAPNNDARQVLSQLANWSAQHPSVNGGLLAHDGLAPRIAPALLSGAHPGQC